MIRLVDIAIEMTTDKGRVAGSYSFAPGLQVLSGSNRLGKSTAFAATVWCLGVEHIFGTVVNDTSIFPDAVKAGSRVLLGAPDDDTDSEIVVSSRARLIIHRDDGDVLTLTRGITSDTEKVRFESANSSSGVVTVGWGSFGDETSGFQAAFRKWARIPNADLMSRTRGKEVAIYLENLAPLFLIEQLAGWSDIQAEQVHRYGTIDVDAGAVELLLGEEERLAARLEEQRGAATVASLRAEARTIAADVTTLFTSQGSDETIGTGGTIEALVTRWRDLDLFALAAEKLNFNSDQQRATLRQRIDTLREKITKGRIDTKSTAETGDAAASVVALKERRANLESTMNALRTQQAEQSRLLSTITTRQKSATDLQRLKTRGIGIGCGSFPTEANRNEIDHLTLLRRGFGGGSGSGILASL